MSIERMAAISSAAPQEPERGRAATAEETSVRLLAQEFEAMLMLQMIQQMRHAMLDPEGDDSGLGAGTMKETIDAELARALSAQGGIGLGAFFARALTPPAPGRGAVEGPSPSAAVPAPVLPATTAPNPTVGGAAAAPPPQGSSAMPVPGPTTSAFGWRRDPFDGSQRFHAGVDIRAAYGRDVGAVAEGTVVFAGTRGGYGTTVVVSHGGGLETRYAHLSEVTVREGDRVGRGDPVGQVGASGRATGPHLHFEVIVDGRRVDPARHVDQLAATLKARGAGVDSPQEWAPQRAVASGVGDEN